MTRLLPLASAFLLAACAVGPHHAPPATPASAAGPLVSAADARLFAPESTPDAWWRLYEDPALDALIAQTFVANPDLRVATANLREARAILREARTARLPDTTVSGSAQYQRFGGAQNSRIGGGSTGDPGAPPGTFESDVYSVGLDLAYEVDLFGRVGRLIAAARADADALAAARDATAIAIVAETVRAYADACSAARQREVAVRSIDVQRQSFDLTERLRSAGRGTALDVARARAQLEQTRATLPQFETDRRNALFRLAVLTGQAPATPLPAAAACALAPTLDRPIPVGDGAALLRRRPDVRQADRRLAAATARIGVAVADLYPRISLGGGISTSAFNLGDLGDSSAVAFNLGPLLSWSFPNVAAARARVGQAEARAEAELASFDGTVLTALQEAETALGTYAGELQRNAALRSARDLSAEAVRIVRLRYKFGAEGFLAVLDAERTLADTEAQLAASDALVTTRQVEVFRALGGGWQAAPPLATAAR